ncbi:MAG: hypothetical protein EHM33_07480 [Chloroflexi bacterium]|nr:MAG: hypothetical protein EHM33_07480 [Chloroflexota bacterium]
MKSRLLHWLAIVFILETGLLHIITAQAEYEGAAYMGYLFAANFFGSLIAASGIYRRQLWGWVIGLIISALSIAGYVWSRMWGMPEMQVEEWLAPYGLVAMSVEGIFIILCLLRPWRLSPVAPSTSESSRLRYILPIAGLLIISSVSVFAYRWNVAATQQYGHHVGSLDQVCNTPTTSFAEFEERYGVRISLVAVSMMDSIVDVRLKVVDPDKAAALLKNQAALLVDQEVLILAPHQHHHGSIKRDKIHFLFFPTQNGTVYAGSQVSLVFGSVRLETVTVK